MGDQEIIDWIDVEDGLPDDRAWVLGYAPGRSAKYRVDMYLFTWDLGHAWWLGGQHYIHDERDVTHWARVRGPLAGGARSVSRETCPGRGNGETS